MNDTDPEHHDDSREPGAAGHLDGDVLILLKRILNRLASDQEAAAAHEAAHVPYWKPCPISVIGSRAAGRALRDVAESLSAVPR